MRQGLYFLLITLLTQSLALYQLYLSSPPKPEPWRAFALHNATAPQMANHPLSAAVWQELIAAYWANTPLPCCARLGEYLTSFGIFKGLQLKSPQPGLLRIQYELRQPLFHLGDRHNSAIDEEGVITASYPFYSPKLLPTVYLGKLLDPLAETNHTLWGARLATSLLQTLRLLTLELEPLAHSCHCRLEALDLTQLSPSSSSTGEIIATLRSAHDQLCYLRFGCFENHLSDQFQKLHTVASDIKAELKGPSTAPLIVDLRLHHRAFIGYEP